MTPPRRTVAARSNRRELLIFVEGEVTEEDYLRHWHRRFRATINIEIHEFHGTPLALVERAVDSKKENEKLEKRRRGRAHDEVWCVFDVDAHPYVDEARRLAQTHGVKLAISNPCIELWFLLHFHDQTAHIDRRAVQKEAKKHLACGKSLSEEALGSLDDRFDLAKLRAQRLDEKHRGDQTPLPGNPSSDMWRVVDSIRFCSN